MTAPRRRWSRFLPLAFIVTAMAASVVTLVVCAKARNAHQAGFTVAGNLNQGEIAEICGLIQGSPTLNSHVVEEIQIYAPGKACVTTKLKTASRSRGGAVVLFDETDGGWNLVSIEPYDE